MFKEETLFLLIKNWWKWKPEDELYHRLQENPYWPFKSVADGYYYVVVQSDRAAYGIWGMIGTIIGYTVSSAVLGFYSIPQSFFLLSFLASIWALKGRIAWRELIISRRGRGSYMLRVLSNHEKLIQHELRNIYIRLAKKDDSSGDPYFWLNLSGYELDDYRITRMTKAESALRIMGMRLAYRLGVNFFDWKDESEEHLVFHYKTFTKPVLHPVGYNSKGRESGQGADDDRQDMEAPKGTFLSVPSRRGRLGSAEGSPKLGSVSEDESSKRKVMIDQRVDVKRI